MTFIYAACIWIAWAPANGAARYNAYLDRTYLDTIYGTELELCIDENYVEHELFVVGLAAGDYGPDSDSFVFVWVPDFDRNRNGSVGFSDFGALAAVWGSRSPSDLWADVDGSGTVDWPDFGAFVARFGRCNNGEFEIDCG